MGEINYKNCPVCGSDKNKIHSVVRDYSVSKKEFSYHFWSYPFSL